MYKIRQTLMLVTRVYMFLEPPFYTWNPRTSFRLLLLTVYVYWG